MDHNSRQKPSHRVTSGPVGAELFLCETCFYWKQARWLQCVSRRPTARWCDSALTCIHGGVEFGREGKLLPPFLFVCNGEEAIDLCAWGAGIPPLNNPQRDASDPVNSHTQKKTTICKYCSLNAKSTVLLFFWKVRVQHQLGAHLQHSSIPGDHKILSLRLWGGVWVRTSCHWWIYMTAANVLWCRLTASPIGRCCCDWHFKDRCQIKSRL